MFALRTGFLLTLFVLILFFPDWNDPDRQLAPIRFWPKVNHTMFTLCSLTLLAVVLLAAPTGMAGAICKDKTSGGLIHLLGTDLTDAEIVLGKFMAHFWPIVGLLLSILPIPALMSFQGGVDPEIVVGAFVVLLGTALFVCSFAFFLSMWGRHAHEILAVVHLLVLILVGAPLIWSMFAPVPMIRFNPFFLVTARGVTLEDQLWYFLACLVLFSLFMTATWRLLRRVALSQISAEGTAPSKRRAAWRARHLLDSFPMMWLEHGRRSGWARRTWQLYWLITAVLLALTVFVDWGPRTFEQFVVIFWPTLALAGLLLLNVEAVASLAEDKHRGALDVLLTTPISTFEILKAKWIACVVPVLLLMIAPVCAYSYMCSVSTFCKPNSSHPIVGAFFFTTSMIVHAVFFVSLGLFTALRTTSTAKGVAAGIVTWILANALLLGFLLSAGTVGSSEFWLLCGSQWVSLIFSFVIGIEPVAESEIGSLTAWLLFYVAISCALMHDTFRTFNRLTGRSGLKTRHWPRERQLDEATRV